jgi:hypothetical protein
MWTASYSYKERFLHQQTPDLSFFCTWPIPQQCELKKAFYWSEGLHNGTNVRTIKRSENRTVTFKRENSFVCLFLPCFVLFFPSPVVQEVRLICLYLYYSEMACCIFVLRPANSKTWRHVFRNTSLKKEANSTRHFGRRISKLSRLALS